MKPDHLSLIALALAGAFFLYTKVLRHPPGLPGSPPALSSPAPSPTAIPGSASSGAPVALRLLEQKRDNDIAQARQRLDIARNSLDQAKASVESARRNLELARIAVRRENEIYRRKRDLAVSTAGELGAIGVTVPSPEPPPDSLRREIDQRQSDLLAAEQRFTAQKRDFDNAEQICANEIEAANLRFREAALSMGISP